MYSETWRIRVLRRGSVRLTSRAGISIDDPVERSNFLGELDFSSRVTNQELFNRYDWHSGRSIVRPPRSLSFPVLSPPSALPPLLSCRTMRQS